MKEVDERNNELRNMDIKSTLLRIEMKLDDLLNLKNAIPERMSRSELCSRLGLDYRTLQRYVTQFDLDVSPIMRQGNVNPKFTKEDYYTLDEFLTKYHIKRRRAE